MNEADVVDTILGFVFGVFGIAVAAAVGSTIIAGVGKAVMHWDEDEGSE